MSKPASNLESKILYFSAVLALGFAVMGIAVGIWLSSIVIFFDGIYSLLSLGLTLLSLIAAKLIAAPSCAKYPLGLATLEPIVIAIKACVILAVVITSLYSAFDAMLHGGRTIDASIASLFGIVNVIGCALGWRVIVHLNKNANSGLIDAETTQWKMDTIISLAVLVGFVVAWLLTQSPLAHYANYADPIMMLIMGGYFLKVPYEMLKSAVQELLNKSADETVCKQVMQHVSSTNRTQDMDMQVTAITKVGNELRVNIDVIVHEDEQLRYNDIEHTRTSLNSKLAILPYKLRVNMNLAM
ncbi:cation transporter [Vibrio gallicus]|uniref:cation transporter n=1 Tax=Vibrio gallicus TaxID=190897 RepID=UPI0021C345E4|nr:cation transporter [Vibrio gallicus]